MTILPRVAVLVDLPRGEAAGGHVKYWERLAEASAKEDAPVDLTVYFSGKGDDAVLSEHVRFRMLPPVFSTARLTFLPYVPAHTDLAPHHPALARELPRYDVIHSTDGFFAFARTAERVARRSRIPLVTSFHTDTPAYAEVFTRQTIQSLLGRKLGERLDARLRFSARERRHKEKRLRKHLSACSAVFAMRPEDISFAQKVVGAGTIKPMRLGVDKAVFKPCAEAREEVGRACGIDPSAFLVLFVGRIDAGKNMPLLMQACRNVLDKGVKLHLVVAGLGPLAGEVKGLLQENASLVGQVSSEKLAQLYAAADCLAMASDIEIGGLVSAEALACGCPVLVSKACGAAALCGFPSAMKEVESDVSAWTETLVSLAQNVEWQKAMRAAAQDFRREKIAGWDDVLLEDFLPVWQDVARKSVRPFAPR